VREKVDLVIEFQTSQESSSFVASRIEEAGIPLIAIDIPHPGADYFGANNYRAGLLGGQALAQACIRQWRGNAEEVVLLDLPIAGPLVRSRLLGMLAGLRELRLNVRDESVHFIDGNGRFEKSWDVMRRYLRRSRSAKTLVGAVNDPSCLGALRAFEEAGRAEQCLAVSQSACIEARREMRRPRSRLVASVGFFPERYGETVIALALDKIQGRHIPSATFMKHQVITVENVDKLYPNDILIPNGDSDSLL
jgi:ribose transport system substrate-binding protein